MKHLLYKLNMKVIKISQTLRNIANLRETPPQALDLYLWIWISGEK